MKMPKGQAAPEKESPKKTRGIVRTEARPQKAPGKSFLNPKEYSSMKKGC